MRQPIRVNPVNSVPDQKLIDNIAENLRIIKHWVQKWGIHNDIAWMFSGGPSTKRTLSLGLLSNSMFQRNPDNIVFCIKHALPVLKEHGIKPYGCIVLDPRPLDGTSTHGYVRSTLFDAAPKETIFFIASMTNPEVTKYLMSKGHTVIGWHAVVSGLDKFQGIEFAVDGGTCSATRSIGLLHLLGFRKLRYVGMDACLSKRPSDEELKDIDPVSQRPKIQKIICNGHKFYTTGELIALMQDFTQLCQQKMIDMDIAFVGADTKTSAIIATLEATQRDPVIRKPSVYEVLGTPSERGIL